MYADKIANRAPVSQTPSTTASTESAAPQGHAPAAAMPHRLGEIDVAARDTALSKPTESEAAVAMEGGEPWWKLRLECMVDGEPHSLYFLGTTDEPKLVINPNVQYLVEYVKRVSALPQAKTPAAAKGLGEVAQQVEILQKIAASKDKAKYALIHTELIKTAKQLATLGDAIHVLGVARPPSHVVFESSNDQHGQEYAIKVSAMVLSLDPGDSPGGSPPVEQSTWGSIHGRHPSFVRGHMLNKHLHGPGTANNLTPLTDQVNRKMSGSVEEYLKEAVLELGRVYQYIIEAQYAGHPEKAKYSEFDRKYIPTTIICTWQRMARKQGKSGAEAADWELKGPRSTLPIQQTLPDAASETQRGHKRGHQLLGQFLSDSSKKPGKSKIQKEMHKHAKTGQKTMEEMLKRQTAKAPVPSSSPAPSSASASSSSPAPSSAPGPSKPIRDAMAEALLTFDNYIAEHYDPKDDDDNFTDLLVSAYEKATSAYMKACARFGVEDDSWDELLEEKLTVREQEHRARLKR